MWKFMRHGCGLLLLCFATVQLHDPDPLIWVIAYGVAAASVVWPDIYLGWLRISFGVLYLWAAIWLFPETYYGVGDMVVDRPEIEQARESLGMMMAGLLILGSVWLNHKELNNLAQMSGEQDEQ